MQRYIVKRLLLAIPTLFFILLCNFVLVQMAPGGPVEQAIEKARHSTLGEQGSSESAGDNRYQGSQGLSPEMVEQIKAQYGFDKGPITRFWIMVKGFLQFDFGTSFFKDKPVTELIKDKLPVSISLGLWSTLLVYAIAIPLGIRKAVAHGSRFDQFSGLLIVVGYAIPAFLFAIILLVLFAGGSYWQIFPLQGMVSEGFSDLSTGQKIIDYAWHMALPLLAATIGGFAGLTYLTKFSFMEELGKQYVLTARAKGLAPRHVLYGHVFRNAMLVVLAGLPSVIVGIFLTGNLLLEIIFNLDGLGLLAYESVQQRDYPVIFGSLFIFTLLGLLLGLISDLAYHWIDPRIDFDQRGKV